MSVLSMVSALRFDNWQWLALTLAAPVVVWSALPFHRRPHPRFTKPLSTIHCRAT